MLHVRRLQTVLKKHSFITKETLALAIDACTNQLSPEMIFLMYMPSNAGLQCSLKTSLIRPIKSNLQARLPYCNPYEVQQIRSFLTLQIAHKEPGIYLRTRSELVII